MSRLSLYEAVDDAPDSPPPALWELCPDLPDSEGDFEPAQPPEDIDAQAIADALVVTRRPRFSKNKKTIQATKLRAQKLLVQEAKRTGDDKLIAAALEFKVGRAAFPALARKSKPHRHKQILIERCAATLGSTGRHNKMTMLSSLSQGLPTSFLTGTLGVTPADVKRAREKRTHQRPGSDFTTQKYTHATKRVKITEHEESLLVQFFVDTTHVLSGAERTTRNLDMRLHEWEHELYAMYPTYLRRVAHSNPDLLTQHQGGKEQRLTKFQASIRAAVAAAQSPDFKVTAEQHMRRREAQARYHRQLALKEGRIPESTEEEVRAEQAKRQRAASFLTVAQQIQNCWRLF